MKKEKRDVKLPSWSFALLLSTILTLAVSAVVFVFSYLAAKERDTGIYMTRAAIYCNNGEIEKAVDIVDAVEPNVGTLPKEYSPLASQIRYKFALSLFAKSYVQFHQGKSAAAANTLAVGEWYIEASGERTPSWVNDLKILIKGMRI